MSGENSENRPARPSNEIEAPETGGALPTPILDQEVIAALLDGRLASPERERVLDALADSEEWSAVFADAATAMQDEPAGGSAEVIPLRRRPARALVRPLAIAAAIAGLALIPALVARGGSDSPAELLSDSRGGLPPGWEERPWSGVRSNEDALTSEARAVRLGVIVAELEVAAGAGAPAGSGLAEQAARLLEGTPGGGPAASLFRGGPAGRELRRARDEAAQLLGEEEVEFGEWLGAARIAAARGDEKFFAASRTRRVLQRAAPEDPAAWPRVRQDAGPPPRWGPLRQALDEVAGAY